MQLNRRGGVAKPGTVHLDGLDVNWDTRLHMAVLQVSIVMLLSINSLFLLGAHPPFLEVSSGVRCR